MHGPDRIFWADLTPFSPKVSPLLDTLAGLNNRQGLGYKVVGKVVDRGRTLNVIFVSATSFFLTVIPVLIALMPLVEETHGQSRACNMTAGERETRLLLRSCSLNATVADMRCVRSRGWCATGGTF
jgi:hypothetical protein